MLNKQFKTRFFLRLLVMLLSTVATAQLPTDSISLFHKTEIITLFKSIDPNKYRLEFKYDGETYGNRQLSRSEWDQLSKAVQSLGESFVLNVPNATIIRLTKECLIYGYSPSRTDPYAIRRLLGPDRTAKLRSYASFYIKDPVL